MPYDVTVDREVCNAYTNCVLAAPDVFELDPAANVAVVLVNPVVGHDDEVLEAVDDCPARAIKATRRD